MKRGPKPNPYSATEEEYATNYVRQYRKCSKPNCATCQEGPGHGPYWYAYHYSPTLKRKIAKYIGKNPPEEILCKGGILSSQGETTQD